MRYRIGPGIAIALLVALSGALAGCGGDAAPAAVSIPACAHAGPPTALPSGFPSSFPFPPNSRITGGHPLYGGIVISGTIAGDFTPTVDGLVAAMPPAGYKILNSEAEPPYDADVEYLGHGYIGRWRIHAHFNASELCPGAQDLTVYAAPRQQPTK